MTLLKKIYARLRLIVDRDGRDYLVVRRLQLFDSEYYFSFFTAPESTVDPLLAYFLHWREWYKTNRFPGAARCQLPDPHPLFDTCYYLLNHFPHGLKRNPFAHYLAKGWKRGWAPSPYFDPETYRQRSSWDGQTGNPLSHYRDHGAPQAISPSPFFDTDWYLDRTPALADAREWIIRHYKMYGARGGRKSPIPVFDPGYYLQQTEENEAARRDPLAHYVRLEEKTGQRPAELFDPRYYRQRYLKKKKHCSPLAHYLSHGVYGGNFPDERIATLSRKPRVSILVPVYNADHRHLNTCIRSVLYQAYPYWELCLVDDCSTDAAIKTILADWEGRDQRIKVAYHQENTGISGATATAAELATGEYLGFLDHDDALTPDCLYRMVQAVNETGAVVAYSDESLVGDDGSQLSVFHKPAFNRHLLLSHNYITHFVLIEAHYFRKIGGIGRGFDGAQDFDLMLRAAEAASHIAHVPKILYHWRATDSSSSINHDTKPYAHDAGKRALAASLKRQGIDAEVVDNHLTFYYRINYKRREKPKVSVVFWREAGHHHAGITAEHLLGRAGYEPCELLVVDHAPANRGGVSRSKTVLLDEAIRASSGEYIVLFGYGGSEISEGWLDVMAGTLFHDDNLGAVCGCVSWAGEDGPSYTVPDLDDRSSRYYAEALASMTRHLNGLHNPQLVRCCDWRCCLFEKALYERLGGFDGRRYPQLLAMHDWSFRMMQAGKQILYTPYVTVTMDEREPSRDDAAAESEEKRRFQEQWQQVLRQGDPNYNIGVVLEQGIPAARFLDWLTGTG